MFKKAFFILFIFSSINSVFSQDSIRIILDYKMVHMVDTTQPTNPRIIPCMLIAGTKMSLYDDYYRSMRYLGYKGISVDRVYDNQTDIEEAVAGITSDQIFTNFEKKELTTGSYFWKTLYTKVEPLTKIEWKIQPQKKKILSLECLMATTTFRGRNYTAWFAPAIPINAGPWKLNGLPGIILAANDDKNEISFTCTKVTVPEANLPLITALKNATLLSTEKFNKTKKMFDKDPKANVGITDPRGTIVAVTTSMANPIDMQTKSKNRKLNNPIEKE